MNRGDVGRVARSVKEEKSWGGEGSISKERETEESRS